MLQTGIALAYLWPADVVDVGDEVQVDVRGRRGSAVVTRPPFVERDPR
jgi:glycine cleavage system aminomethyltransferase T